MLVYRFGGAGRRKIRITMAISANSLFHFTGTLEILQNILEEGSFWPIFCVEYDKGPMENGKYIAVPIVCFCDLPLTQIQEHTRDYGFYGIGLNKKWGNKKGVSPITYYYSKNSISWTLFKNNGNKLTLKEKMRWFSQLKRYYGKTWSLSKGKYINKILYNEREWRYVPKSIEEANSRILVEEVESFSGKEKSEATKKYSIAFGVDDVKYIIVKSDVDKNNLIQFIRKSAVLSINADALCSKILTLKQIREDF